MDRTQALALLIAAAMAAGSCGESAENRTLRIGSKNFTEQVILGEIVAQHLEHRLQRRVERKLNLGGTLLAHQALSSGGIDLYPEYTGTALTSILKQPPLTNAGEVLSRVRQAYRENHAVEWLDPLGIDNGFAMAVRGEDARAAKIETLTDAAHARAWTLGVGYEFEQRADGLPAIDAAYRFRWEGRPKTMDLGLLYRAIEQRQVSMIAANATDGLLAKLDLKILTDDKHVFPPYEVAIAVRQDTLSRVPGLREALAELSGQFTNETMRKLNYAVDGEHRPLAAVAAGFLQQAELR